MRLLRCDAMRCDMNHSVMLMPRHKTCEGTATCASVGSLAFFPYLLPWLTKCERASVGISIKDWLA